jgi:integrase
VPAIQRGSVVRLRHGWAARWREPGPDGRPVRRQQGGFETRTAARVWLNENLSPDGRPSVRMDAISVREGVTLTAFVERYLAVHALGREATTIVTLRERLRRPLAAFGDVALDDLATRMVEIAEWQSTLPPGYRYAIVRAFRQVLAAAERWELIDKNPARMIGPNPEPCQEEIQPFTLAEIDRLAVELGPWGPMVVIASETGLRPSEWIALEWRDVAPADGIVVVERSFVRGALRNYGKTSRSRRRIPLTARTITALEELPPRRLDRRLVFADARGGHVDLNNWRRRQWAPALDAAGITHRRPYDLRHTFASFALDAGISIFELSRYMGTGVRVIDRTYGHLVPGSEERARAKLERRAQRERAVADSSQTSSPR